MLLHFLIDFRGGGRDCQRAADPLTRSRRQARCSPPQKRCSRNIASASGPPPSLQYRYRKNLAPHVCPQLRSRAADSCDGRVGNCGQASTPAQNRTDFQFPPRPRTKQPQRTRTRTRTQHAAPVSASEQCCCPAAAAAAVPRARVGPCGDAGRGRRSGGRHDGRAGRWPHAAAQNGNAVSPMQCVTTMRSAWQARARA